MLIDCSYFTKGSRQILNATLGRIPNANAVEAGQVIEGFIAELQETFLMRMLGNVRGSRVNAYLVCLDEDEKAKRFDNLDVVCDRLKEPFADYVFFHFLRDTATQATINGLMRIKSANYHVAPIRRQVNVWNSMADKNRLFAAWALTEECPVSDIEVHEDMLTYINQLNL